VLERLAARHEIAYLLTRPDRPRGRGRRLASPPAKEVAEGLGIRVRQPERLDDGFDPEVETIVVVAYGQLVPSNLLKRARWLNVHPSLLPRWRGAAPVERALMAGDEETGVSIIELVEELDAGPIAAQQRFSVEIDDDAGAIFTRAAELTPDLINAALETRQPEPQTEDGVTYAEKIGPADRTLDPTAPPVAQERVVRALRPHIGARIELDDGSFLGVWDARVAGDTLELLEVQPPGGRRMSFADYRRGRGA